jgi:hypothetical protein
MALEQENSLIQYTPTAGTTAFNYPYPFFETTDIQVRIQDTNGLESTPSFTVVATNGNPQTGGVVTLDTGTTAGDVVAIFRRVPYTQEYDLQEGAAIDPTALNTALDRVVAQNQRQEIEQDRMVRLPDSDPADADGKPTLNYTVAGVEERKGKMLAFDNSGNITTLTIAEQGAENPIIGADFNRGMQILQSQIGIRDLGVTTSLINNLAVTTEKLNDLAVTSEKIKDFAITSDKINGSAVVTGKIADSAVTLTKIQDIANYRVLGNTSGGSTSPKQVTITNDDTMSTASVTTLATGASIRDYVTAQIAASASKVQFYKLSGGTHPLSSSGGSSYTYQFNDFTSDATEFDNTKITNLLIRARATANAQGEDESASVSLRTKIGTTIELNTDLASASGRNAQDSILVNLPVSTNVTSIQIVLARDGGSTFFHIIGATTVG